MIDHHADVVGSLLRPVWLLQARSDYAKGRIPREEFEKIENRAVDAAIELQEKAGLQIVTDGEMRRLSFQSQLLAAVDGFGETGGEEANLREENLDAFLWGNWFGGAEVGHRRRRRPKQLGVREKLTRRRWLSVPEFEYLRGRTEGVAKISIPSPSLWANFYSPEHSTAAYPTLDEFLDDVTSILCQEVEQLVSLGAQYLQLDAPHYPLLIDPSTRSFYEELGRSADDWLQAGIELDNTVMGQFPDVTFGLHLCRGNQESRWLARGGYDLIADQIFPRTRANRLLLEFDDERSGSFEPLRKVSDDKIVVLGLVSTKTGCIESVSELRKRVLEAARYFPLDQLGLSPQCGFASSIVGNQISTNQQADKLGLTAEAAMAIWGS